MTKRMVCNSGKVATARIQQGGGVLLDCSPGGNSASTLRKRFARAAERKAKRKSARRARRNNR